MPRDAKLDALLKEYRRVQVSIAHMTVRVRRGDSNSWAIRQDREDLIYERYQLDVAIRRYVIYGFDDEPP